MTRGARVRAAGTVGEAGSAAWAVKARVLAALVAGATLALAFARPAEVSGQVPPTSEMAVDLEAAAFRLHGQPERWEDAAKLYLVAADLRQHEDPQARSDLFLAASLYFALGDEAASLDALESAATRALAAGSTAEAMRLLAHAAWTARGAGLTARHRKLMERVAQTDAARPTPPRRAAPLTS